MQIIVIMLDENHVNMEVHIWLIIAREIRRKLRKVSYYNSFPE